MFDSMLLQHFSLDSAFFACPWRLALVSGTLKPLFVLIMLYTLYLVLSLGKPIP